MKKQVKKLTLSRETLRLLDDLAPGRVLGGNDPAQRDNMDTASGCCADTVSCPGNC